MGLPVEHLDRDVDLALLQAELCESRDGSFALRVNLERLLAAFLRGLDVLLPLEERETLVDHREDVHRRWPDRQSDRFQ